MSRPSSDRTRAAALTLAVLGLCLAPIGLESESELTQRIFDALHVPLFAAATYALNLILCNARPTRRFNAPIAAAIAGVAAVVIELLQPYFDRSASFIDLRNGLFGVAIATGWAALPRSPSLPTLLLQTVSSLAVFVYTLGPAYQEYAITSWRAAHLPLLADFEDELELQLWRATGEATLALSAERALSGTHSLVIQTKSGDWSGVGLRGGDASWKHYEALEIGVFSEATTPFTLGVRIDDSGPSREYSDRFNRGIPVTPGWNRIRISTAAIAAGPKNRRLDMDSIRRMVLFVAPEEPPRRIFIDGVKLVHDSSLTP